MFLEREATGPRGYGATGLRGYGATGLRGYVATWLRGRHNIHNRYGLLTKREVKMTGYWPSSFFACLWTETKSRSINTQKKNEANIQSS